MAFEHSSAFKPLTMSYFCKLVMKHKTTYKCRHEGDSVNSAATCYVILDILQRRDMTALLGFASNRALLYSRYFSVYLYLFGVCFY